MHLVFSSWKDTQSYILHLDRRQQSGTLDVCSFRGADCDAEYHLVVAKVTGRLLVRKQAVQTFNMERFNLEKLNDEEYHVKISNRFAALQNLNDNANTDRAWESIGKSIRI
jgi:phosphoribosylaminoimidazole carboxylase (NCAIR synthetase)